MSQITYLNKDNTAIDNIKNKWRDVDANEVKSVVNTKEDVASGIVASGTDTYTATDNTGVTSYVIGQKYLVKFTNSNTGASTLNINSLGAVPIKKNVNTALSSGDISGGQLLILAYDGTNFQVIGIGGGGGGGGWALTGNTTLTGAVTIIGDSSKTIKYKFDGLGVTPTNGAGLWLANTTAATLGNQQISPSLLLEGQGWQTGTGGSQSVKVSTSILPVQQSISLSGGQYLIKSSINNGAYNTLMSIDVNTSKIILTGDPTYYVPPRLIEFTRYTSGSVISGQGQMGFLGSTEMNMTNNMDYTLGSHRYFDTTKNAIWTYLGNGVSSGFGIQWVKSGHTNDDTMWTTYGAVVFSVDVIPNTSTGEAVTGGTNVTLQKITMIDDNYVSSNAVIKLSAQVMSVTGPASVSLPKLALGTAYIGSTEVYNFKQTGANTYMITENADNNSNYNQYRWLKNKAGSYNIGAGTKVFEFDINGGVGAFSARGTSTVNGGFSNIEFIFTTTNSAGTYADRIAISQAGDVVFLNTAFGPVLKSANGHYWRLLVDNTGVITTSDLGTTY